MKSALLLCISFLFIVFNLFSQNEIEVKYQVGKPFNIRSYLIYEPKSKDAAFIDAGCAIDSLLLTIQNKGLKPKYVFLTHAHQDHIVGLKEIKSKFPEIRICFSEEEYDDFKMYMQWKKLFDAKSVEQWMKDSSIIKLMNFDYLQVKKPDILIKNNQKFKIGEIILKAIKTPGHSRGGTTCAIANYIFPGDLILYHSSGYLDYSLCSKDDIIKSIRLLYGLFPDSTIIYSGHGKSSTIGYEKSNNRNVRINEVNFNN